MLSVACDENLVLVSKDMDANEYHRRKDWGRSLLLLHLTGIRNVDFITSLLSCVCGHCGVLSINRGGAKKTVMLSPFLLFSSMDAAVDKQ